MKRRWRLRETEGASGGAKRARTGPTFTDNQEMSIIYFVKDHPELYIKENAAMLTRPERTPCGTRLVKR